MHSPSVPNKVQDTQGCVLFYLLLLEKKRAQKAFRNPCVDSRCGRSSRENKEGRGRGEVDVEAFLRSGLVAGFKSVETKERQKKKGSERRAEEGRKERKELKKTEKKKKIDGQVSFQGGGVRTLPGRFQLSHRPLGPSSILHPPSSTFHLPFSSILSAPPFWLGVVY